MRAMKRKGEDQEEETLLDAGETLLLQGSWGALQHHLDYPDVLARRRIPR